MDWGLLDSNAGENKFLREEVVYSSYVSTSLQKKLKIKLKKKKLKNIKKNNEKNNYIHDKLY